MDIFTLADQYIALLQSTPLGTLLYLPLILIGVDVVTGILAALKQGVFTWKRIFAFLSQNVAPYLLIVGVVFVVYWLSGNTLAVQVGIALGMGSHVLSMLGSINENLKELQVAPAVLQTIEQVEQRVYPSYSTIPPQFVAPIDRQPTQIQPIVPQVIRTNTPPVLPAPPPLDTPPPSPNTLASLPSGL